MSKRRVPALVLAACIAAGLLAGCNASEPAAASKKTIVFGDAGWDSIRFHNAVAGFILESAYGYRTQEVSGTTAVTYKALLEGDIGVYMETWTDSLATYRDDLASGEIAELSVNFDDNKQGLYVPRYVIEGDKTRGIEPLAPDLKSIADLAKYKDVFADPEEKGKGRLYGSIPGWEVDKILYNKYLKYHLDDTYTYFRPGSDAALAAAFTAAYEKGEPVVGYYWEPTWLTGKYDLVLLEDEPYNAENYLDGVGAFPSVRVTVCVNKKLLTEAPDAVEFLKKYKTSSGLTASALAYMAETKADYRQTAVWFLKGNDSLLSDWLPADKAELVRVALSEG